MTQWLSDYKSQTVGLIQYYFSSTISFLVEGYRAKARIDSSSQHQLLKSQVVHKLCGLRPVSRVIGWQNSKCISASQIQLVPRNLYAMEFRDSYLSRILAMVLKSKSNYKLQQQLLLAICLMFFMELQKGNPKIKIFVYTLINYLVSNKIISSLSVIWYAL